MTSPTQTLNRLVDFLVRENIALPDNEARVKQIPLDIDTIKYYCSMSGEHPQPSLNLYKTLMREWYGVEVR